MPKLGRTSKYSPAIVEEICKYVRAGNTHRDAAILVGINEDTFYSWRSDPKKPEFLEALKKAEAEIKARHIQNVRKAAFGDGNRAPVWQASAWWLERRYQDEFAMKYKLEHGGKEGGPLQMVVRQIQSKLKDMGPEDLKRIAKGL